MRLSSLTVTPDDVKALAGPTLRHRMSLRPEAELEGVSVDAVLDGVLASVSIKSMACRIAGSCSAGFMHSHHFFIKNLLNPY